jgi:ADP-ribose pyrophosphatase YjhB (NUDIX family)
MRTCVRAIVVNGENILLIHRNKFGKRYYTLPGGGVDDGEGLEAAVLRELSEETSLSVKINRKVAIETPKDFGPQHVYLCEYGGGVPVLRDDSEEAMSNRAGGNTYEPVWLPIAELPAAEFVSPSLKNFLLDGLQNSFPDAPQML